jgi:hypothetical protein
MGDTWQYRQVPCERQGFACRDVLGLLVEVHAALESVPPLLIATVVASQRIVLLVGVIASEQNDGFEANAACSSFSVVGEPSSP